MKIRRAKKPEDSTPKHEPFVESMKQKIGDLTLDEISYTPIKPGEKREVPKGTYRLVVGEHVSLQPEPTRVGSAMVEAVPFQGVAPLLTLEDPGAPPEKAAGAFARLLPPDDHPPGETASWRNLVAAQAIAARVVPRPRRREVLLPNEQRPTPAADVRAEATALAAATNDPEVAKLVESILSEVERPS